jgi:hypothetical protein
MDKSTTDCTSDAECQERFRNSDMACLARGTNYDCRPEVQKCCQRRSCSRTNPCDNGACCSSFASGGREVCCAPGQVCNAFLGCTAL